MHDNHAGSFIFGREQRVFFSVWLGQVVSLFGSALTGFALGLWVYQKNGSLTEYTLIALAALLPRLLASTLAGPLVDRWERRKTMLLSDLGAGLCSLAVFFLLLAGRLEVWHVYVSVGLGAVFGSFQAPAYAAAITQLVPKQQFGRANGMVQLSQALAEIFAPLAAGFLLGSIRIEGILLIDFVTFLVAVGCLAWVRFPALQTAGQAAAPRLNPAALLRESAAGWCLIAAQKGLLGLLLILAAFNFQWSTVGVLAMPLFLSLSDTRGLGILLTVAGVGMLTGSLAMSAWGGPRRRVWGMLVFECFSGICFVMMGLRPLVLLAGLGALGAHLTIAVIAGCNHALWQQKIAPDMQGRVFAIQELIGKSIAPLAILAAGPLGERLFEPLLAPGGALAGSIGVVIGVGPGRGLAFIFVLMGLAQVTIAAAGALFRPLRTLENDLPDVV